MGEMAADRVFDDHADVQRLFAATGMGVAEVEASGDAIGRFRLARECDARDLAGAGGWLAAATAGDVLACPIEEDGPGEWVETGFGPAVAVGFDAGDLLAASPDGELGRVVDVDADPTEWLSVAAVDGAVRAIDGPLVGAADGVYRFNPDGIVDVGLDDVRDVSATAVPLAATGDGLFRLGNGWLRELDGAVDVVTGTDTPAADTPPHAGDGVLARANAAAGPQLYEYRGERPDPNADEGSTGGGGGSDHGGGGSGDGGRGPGGEGGGAGDAGEDSGAAGGAAGDPDDLDGEIVHPAVAARAWRERATPEGPVVAVAYGLRTYALTADGTVMLDRGDAWAARSMGLPDARALATPE